MIYRLFNGAIGNVTRLKIIKSMEKRKKYITFRITHFVNGFFYYKWFQIKRITGRFSLQTVCYAMFLSENKQLLTFGFSDHRV